MAIPKDRRSPAKPKATQRRVIVKLRSAPKDRSGGELLAADRASIGELIGVPEAAIEPLVSPAEQLEAASMPPFDRYIAVKVPDREAAAALAERLRRLDAVEEAYVESGPAPPPVIVDNNPYSAQQGHLDAAPIGIGARWAWPLTRGEGVGFVDLEQGWTLDHEDLVDAHITLLPKGSNDDFHGHGTSVLGVVVGVDNERGGIGIAPSAGARVVSQWRENGDFDTVAAILSAAAAMNPGDILLLEAQTEDELPVEIESAVFAAIRGAVDKGIVVVEAAGNSGDDLDLYVSPSGRVVTRAGPDSGAILVGAASSDASHWPVVESNFGSRIDCFAWGENIVTAGDGLQGTSTTDYTQYFNSTSGASAIVAGAAILLQSWGKKENGAAYSPKIVRDRLSAKALNTKSAKPGKDRIGVMPDLREILIAEGAPDDRRRPLRGGRLRRALRGLMGFLGRGSASPG